jgi:3-hydroxybutyryl-CoA dehydrogenase
MKNISVIGAGLMGSQIAFASALAGYNVTLNDIDDQRLTGGFNALLKQVNKYVEKGLLSEKQLQQAVEHISLDSSIENAVAKADLVIEAIVEDVDKKRALFAQLDTLTPAHTIFATNSSMIVSSMLADHTNRASQVCNLHFFNPVLIMGVVEVVQGEHTSDDTAQKAIDYVKQIGKIPLHLQKEIPGFIANRILGKVMEEAIYLLEQGIATVEEIDLACTKALNYPIGPFALMDMTGLDTAYAVQQTKFELEQGGKEPSPLLKEMLELGKLGRKSGEGFYTYR